MDELKSLKLSAPLRVVLTDLARLYALDGISKNSGEFMEVIVILLVLVKTFEMHSLIRCLGNMKRGCERFIPACLI